MPAALAFDVFSALPMVALRTHCLGFDERKGAMRVQDLLPQSWCGLLGVSLPLPLRL